MPIAFSTNRNEPGFFIIGAQKSGTSWLWSMLKQHPGASLPKQKEIDYFGSSELYARGDDWYFSYFDGLRQYNVNIKAAHTMGDLLSRETELVDDDYIDGMHDVVKFLVRADGDPRMRISVVAYDSGDDAFELKWSEVRGGGKALTPGSLNEITDRLPQAFGGSQLIVVETAVDHKAPFIFGVGDQTLTNFLVTRLRFVPELGHKDMTETS